MNIKVICRGHQYYRDVELILQLFFESLYVLFVDEKGKEVKTIGESVEQSKSKTSGTFDYTVILTLTMSGQSITAQADLSGVNLPSSLTEKYQMEATSDEVLNRKNSKRSLKLTLLKVLQEATGVNQPWGILTGIRPVKLFHTMLSNDITAEKVGQIFEKKYLVQPSKVELLQQIVDYQLQAIPDLYQLNDDEVSIYIGIPFCPTKCAYCTFPAYAINGRSGSVEGFLEGLLYEIKHIGQWLQETGMGVTTIYFGGGTPTSIEEEQMEELFQQLSRYIDLKKVRELTVEAGRPDTITPEKIEVMKKWKVDRISINPQSFTQDTLNAIGRHHTVEETVEKYHLARSMGLNNINMDLIIGLPGEDRRQLADSLQHVEELMPESLTVHTLSFKRASTMTKNKEKYKVAGREEIDLMMKMAARWTGEKGYKPYYLYRQKNILGNLENVGYSLPGKESLYNIVIMEEKQTIIGLGCGAVGKHIHPVTNKIERWPNPKEPNQYIERYEEITRKKIHDLYQMYSIPVKTP